MKKFTRALAVVLSLTTALPAHAWTVREPIKDELRGTVKVWASVSDALYSTWIHVACENNITTMHISHGDYIFPNHSKITYKVNSSPLRNRTARSSASYDSLFITNPIPMLRHMMEGGNSGKMIIEYELEYYSNEQTTIPLHNFAEAMKPIQKACNWE